ncbi:phosphate-specific transport system accessory protein PhoU [mine drainage metagenome]|uniref:Phosphate-specific transport system accessory protein PhoU n=1 Tax=mine drainage metagenome TaxID=410659 RepID=A0A1J5SD46_9ZZZZ
MEPHIVKSFDEALNTLHAQVSRMGVLAEHQLGLAVQALVDRNDELAGQIVQSDAEIDDLEAAANDQVIRVLALRAPVADDLRVVITALKIASTLERIADYAANIAKRSIVLTAMPAVPTVRPLQRLGKLVQGLLADALTAYHEENAELALQVWTRDKEVDEQYSGLFRELLTYMMEDSRNITPCSHLLFVAKNIERIGDHATNIAEMAHFLASGSPIEGTRPKNDTTITHT